MCTIIIEIRIKFIKIVLSKLKTASKNRWNYEINKLIKWQTLDLELVSLNSNEKIVKLTN